MTRLAIPFALALLLVACRDDTPAGCRAVACVCANGSAGTRACGSHTCVCETGTCVLRSPERFDFGGVPPGVSASGEVALANEGDGACTVAALRLDGCDPAFALGAGFETATVRPGETLPIPVAFRPEEGSGEQTCRLAFGVPESAVPVHAVSLLGHADATCLTVDPPSLSFDLAVAGCGTDEGPVTVSNGCGVPLDLESLSLDGPAFLFLAEPPLPVTLAPGASVPVVVGYRPATPGDHAGLLEVDVAGFGARTIPLAGSAGEAATLTDHFAQEALPQVDLLFVIDNGTAMAGFASEVPSSLRVFLSFAEAEGADFRIGVTTTGLEPGGDCPGGVGGGEDGRLFPVDGSSPRVLAEATPDLDDAWLANTRVGACREGPNPVFEAALRALTPPVVDAADDPRHPEPNDGNLGFLRPDAKLVVIAVTDRADTSPESPGYYHDALLALKGATNRDRFLFFAVTGFREVGCTRAGLGSAEPGDRLIDLVESTPGGMFVPICDTNWDYFFAELSRAALELRTCFYLTEHPADANGDGEVTDADGELEVSVNGEALASRDATGQRFWSYAAEWNAVCFPSRGVPAPSASIDVAYRVECLAR